MMENNLGGKQLTSGSGDWLPKPKKTSGLQNVGVEFELGMSVKAA